MGIFFPTEVAAVRRTNTRLQWLFLLSARLLCSKTRVLAYCASSSGGFREGGICGEGGGGGGGEYEGRWFNFGDGRARTPRQSDGRETHLRYIACLFRNRLGQKRRRRKSIIDTACAVKNRGKKHVLHSDPPRMTNIRSRIETEPRQAMSPFSIPGISRQPSSRLAGGRGRG